MIILTLQEIFDKAASHLLTQNQKSLDGDNDYRYKSLTGLKCPIGILIPDELYRKYFENEKVSVLIEQFKLFPVEQCNFLETLQQIHDKHPVEFWKTELTMLAEDFNLSTTILDQF